MLTIVIMTLLLTRTGTGSQQASQTAERLPTLRAQWVLNLQEKKLEAFVAMYTPDATFIGDGKRTTGRPAIQELAETVMASSTSDIELRSLKTEFSGDLAYDSGDYRETITSIADGKKTPLRGDHLTIYKRGPDRSWLIVQQVWTENRSASH